MDEVAIENDLIVMERGLIAELKLIVLNLYEKYDSLYG